MARVVGPGMTGEEDGGYRGMESPDVLRVHLGRATDGPLMAGATVDACLALLAASDLTIVDLDGPPPELHPRFREIVILVRALRRRLLHRCNLAVAGQPEQAELPEFLADHRVDLVVALPGRPALDPVTASLMQALRRFNAAGYGMAGSGLNLDLVVPTSALDGGRPGRADAAVATALESHGIHFHGLHVVSPVGGGSAGDLLVDLQRLAGAVPASRILRVPSPVTLEVAWDGALSGSSPLGNVRDVRSFDHLVPRTPAPAEMTAGA